MSEDQKIIITEKYGPNCIQSNMQKRPYLRKPEGFVEVYSADEDGNSKQLVGKSNLVLYSGREWLLSRAFNMQNPYIDSSNAEAIYCIGIGNGGCELLNPLAAVPPTNDDTSLQSEIVFTSTPSPLYGDYRAGVGYYKKVLDSCTFEQDAPNNNRYLVAKVSATIGTGDAIGYSINEAGLFTAMSGSGGWDGPFHLFARVTFASIVKVMERRLIFYWYIFV